MKKIIKTSTKKGFTLLEVMLAVAVMAISSTMIMEGFIAVMNCSRNSTIYSRVGGAHYAELIKKIADTSATPLASRTYSGTKSTITFSSGISSGMIIWRNGNSTETVNINAATGNQREADINATYVDNRAAFFYMPTGSAGEFECERGHSGEFVYCYYAGGESSWASPAFRCIHEMAEYNTEGNPFYHDKNHRYCFQYDAAGAPTPTPGS